MTLVNTPNELKKFIENSLKENSIKGLISISFIGSIRKLKSFELVNDVDLLILVDNLDSSNFSEINQKFEEVTKSLNSKDLDFIVENRIGPLKPRKNNNKKVIQLHLLIYQVEKWKTKSHETSTLDWTNFSDLVYGENISDLFPFGRFSKESLLKDFKINLGILNETKAVVKSYYIENSNLKRKSEELSLTEKDKIENICYAVIMAYLNFIRYSNPKFEKDKVKILNLGKKELPKEYYNLLVTSFEVKERLRSGSKVPDTQVRLLKEGAIKFIYFLSDKLND